MAEYHLDPKKIHFKWNNELAAAITVNPGDVVHCWTQEVSNGQVTPGCRAAVLANIDFDNIYPLAGPVAITGAEPGDALEVDILALKPDDWGWTGITGLSLGYLSKARRGGIAQPSVQTVALLARFFGVSAQVFLAPGTPPTAPEPPSVVDEFVAAASANRLR